MNTVGALRWQSSQRNRKVVPPLYPQACKIQMKTTVKVEGTNTYTYIRSLFLMAFKFNYRLNHAVPAQFQPLRDIQPRVSERPRDQDEWISESNISHHSFIKCYYSHD